MSENTKNIKKIVKIDKKEPENENELIKNLKNDEKLRENPDKRMGMISMATMFLEDSHTFGKCLLRIRLPHCFCVYYIIIF